MAPNEITAQIVDAAFKIHLQPGPGLLETVCEASSMVLQNQRASPDKLK
jgi:hypothetical protein